MERREFLWTAAGAAAFAGLGRELFAQGRGAPIDWTADPGKPANVSKDKLARISIMTLNFSAIIKRPNATGGGGGGGRRAGAAADPNAPPPPPPPARTLDAMDIAQMYMDVYGVPNVEFQHNDFPSTEESYLKELRAKYEKTGSRIQQINAEVGTYSTEDPVRMAKIIEDTKTWVDHAVVLNCPKVMLNQGQPTQANKDAIIAALKTVGDYGRAKGVKISNETRGGGGGGRRAAAPGPDGAPAAPPPPPPPPSAPAWALLKEIIEKSNTYSNLDIGGASAPNQEALHEAAKALLPTNSGQTHMKVSQNWDVGTFVKFYEGVGYKGLYTIEVTGHPAIRSVYNTILANI